MHAQEHLLTQVARILRMTHEFEHDMPANRLMIANQTLERPRSTGQDRFHQYSIRQGLLAGHLLLGYVERDNGCSPFDCNRRPRTRIYRNTPDHFPSRTMDMIFAKQTLIPLALFFCVTFAFKLLLDAITRYRMMKEGISETLLAELLRHDAKQRRLSSLRWGIFLVAIGLGFAVLQALGWTRPTAGSIALLAILIGAGQLLYFRLSSRIA
jgi:hypothetical protein